MPGVLRGVAGLDDDLEDIESSTALQRYLLTENLAESREGRKDH